MFLARKPISNTAYYACTGSFNGLGSYYVFLIFLSYMIPVLINGVMTIDVGGVSAYGLAGDGHLNYVVLWSVAIFCFLFGAGRLQGPVRFNVSPQTISALWLAFLVIAPISIVLKILLRSQGVYDSYAFDSGQMTGGVWSMSMSFSELSVYLFALSLAVGNRKLTIGFFFLVCLNLLHGTRIFFVSAVSIFVFYYVSARGISWARFLSISLAFVLLLIGAAVTFIIRSSVVIDWSNPIEVFQYAISPVIYESVFSQLAMLDFANGIHILFNCNPFNYVLDIVGFVLPRFINPDKDSMCIDYLASLQPLGALNGIFGVFAYFQYFSFIFFLILGIAARIIFLKARKNVYFFSLAIYIFGSIILRLVRDGPVYAIKFVSVALFGCLMIYLAQRFLAAIAEPPQDDGVGKTA